MQEDEPETSLTTSSSRSSSSSSTSTTRLSIGSLLMSNFQDRKEIQYFREIEDLMRCKSKRHCGKEVARWSVIFRLAMQGVVAGSSVGSCGHFGYAHELGGWYDLIKDTSIASLVALFWIYIVPNLRETFGDCFTVALIQFSRILVAMSTLLAAIYNNLTILNITASVFIMLDPIFPLVVPLETRTVQRDHQILFFGLVISIAGFTAVLELIMYHFFGTIVGLIFQVVFLTAGCLCALSLKEDDINYEYDEEHRSFFARENLSQMYLWFCVFPVGASTTFIGYDMSAFFGLGNGTLQWSLKEADWMLAILAINAAVVCGFTTCILHYVIDSNPHVRLHALIWWSAYCMTAGACFFTVGIVIEFIFSPSHILYPIFSGCGAGLFIATPDIVLILESSFGAQDFASLCSLFEILYILFGWSLSFIFHVGRNCGLSGDLSFRAGLYFCVSLIVIPYVYIIANFACDSSYIYEKFSNIEEDSEKGLIEENDMLGK